MPLGRGLTSSSLTESLFIIILLLRPAFLLSGGPSVRLSALLVFSVASLDPRVMDTDSSLNRLTEVNDMEEDTGEQENEESVSDGTGKLYQQDLLGSQVSLPKQKNDASSGMKK